MVRVVTQHKLLNERRQQSTVEEVPYKINGKLEKIEKVYDKGAMNRLELDGGKLSGEMVVSTDIKREVVQKTVLDVEMGREAIPLLYGSIYHTISDASLPQIVPMSWAQNGAVVFLEHAEGEEIKFGAMQAETSPMAHLTSYAGGFTWTKEAEIFNQLYLIGAFNEAFGRAHNMMLNHIHLAPIAQFDYKAGNTTKPVYIKTDGANGTQSDHNRYLSVRETLKAGIRDSRLAKRPGTILLANSADQQDIEEALQGAQIMATNYGAVAGIDEIIYYDGDEERVGDRQYEFDGVKQGEAFLIRPQRGFKELVKVPLQIEFEGPDLTRLIQNTMVGYTFRGVYAAVEENVQKIELPKSK